MRAQATVEWVVVISFAILILAVMLSFNEDNYLSFRSNVKVSNVKATLNDLKNAADFVYSQGSGAKTRLHATIPYETNITITTLSDGKGQIQAVIKVKGGEQYFDVYTDGNLTGSLPSKAGEYCVDVECLEGAVSITRSGGSC